jgi:hypothetical protein
MTANPKTSKISLHSPNLVPNKHTKSTPQNKKNSHLPLQQQSPPLPFPFLLQTEDTPTYVFQEQPKSYFCDANYPILQPTPLHKVREEAHILFVHKQCTNGKGKVALKHCLLCVGRKEGRKEGRWVDLVVLSYFAFPFLSFPSLFWFGMGQPFWEGVLFWLLGFLSRSPNNMHPLILVWSFWA